MLGFEARSQQHADKVVVHITPFDERTKCYEMSASSCCSSGGTTTEKLRA